ncbi:MAG: hypothetical protein CVU36_23875 [Betaproteobacteria bacterium HGW-Betaproteobacteria-9]|nr:MAG: hypothetical protein CVU36_23875 [Betaproteobacteria bacterium HGW-Betaproteobacteria-9]
MAASQPMTRLARHSPPKGWTPGLAACCLALLVGSGGSAQASAPGEKVVCTELPRSQWLSEAQARERFKASAYLLVKFKVSRGNCHEFYAIEHGGGIVEVYLHPVTGDVVRMTRLPPLTPEKPR